VVVAYLEGDFYIESFIGDQGKPVVGVGDGQDAILQSSRISYVNHCEIESKSNHWIHVCNSDVEVVGVATVHITSDRGGDGNLVDPKLPCQLGVATTHRMQPVEVSGN